ncbi:MAG: hypothetical protein KIT84_00495 [Labilithrix sp.]|nr:hypothetical protein [Labilithrix sp.]MCW5809462.1 hypothetical protein [Labilithrix sp.]
MADRAREVIRWTLSLAREETTRSSFDFKGRYPGRELWTEREPALNRNQKEPRDEHEEQEAEREYQPGAPTSRARCPADQGRASAIDHQRMQRAQPPGWPHPRAEGAAMSAAARCAKIGYGTEALAAKAATESPSTLRAYLCPSCARWHLTSRQVSDGPLTDELLLRLPATGRMLPVGLFVRRFPDGRTVGITLKAEGHFAYVAVNRKHLHAVKAAIEEVLRSDVESDGV